MIFLNGIILYLILEFNYIILTEYFRILPRPAKLVASESRGGRTSDKSDENPSNTSPFTLFYTWKYTFTLLLICDPVWCRGNVSILLNVLDILW